jgi:perosamine synthetase
MSDFISWAKPDYWGKEKEYVLDALSSTWISGGPYVDRLENDFSKYFDMPHALAVNNGTSAIHLPYLAIGLRPGDEVIVPGFAFMAAANIALICGAKPVFAEVDPKTWCVTAEAIEKCITSKTKAIVPVHTYGNVCAMDDIMSLSSKYPRVFIIEDTAEALGSRYKDKLAGTIGHLGTFSFHATKTITTGEGGLVTTRSSELADAMALYRSHGMRRQRFYWHDVPGHNFRLTNIQAALGCAQFESIEHIIKQRKRVHGLYVRCLEKIQGLEVQSYPIDVDAVLWAIAVRLDIRAFPQGRDSVMSQMKAKNIETRPGFVAPRMMSFYDSPKLPICESLSETVISLPTYPSLTEEQIELICAALSSFRK